MRITDVAKILPPFGLAIVAGTFWFCGGLAAGVNGPVWVHLLAPVLTLIGGVLAGILAGKLSGQNERLAPDEEDWPKFECKNCGDVHNPAHVCYCGCGVWRKGERILK